MRHFYTTVLERRRQFRETVETPPYEGGWASEAVFFVQVESIDVGAALDLRVQISPDGMHWIDEGTGCDTINAVGGSFVKVSHFGGWLRLVGGVYNVGDGAPASVTLTIHLALKE